MMTHFHVRMRQCLTKYGTYLAVGLNGLRLVVVRYK